MFQKTAVTALLLNLSKAAVQDYANGLGGNAPCVSSYVGVWESSAVGYDPHATMGILASNGGHYAVGSSLVKEGGSTGQGLILKTKSCSYSTKYLNLNGTGSDCSKNYDWVTKTGRAMMWMAESPDGTYVIATGYKEVSGKSVMHIVKLKASDGSIVWEMNYGTSSGVETVKFTSDGGFVVGGFTDSDVPLNEMSFKSGGQIETGKPFIGKVSKADADGSSAPSKFAWTYSQSGSDYSGSAKAIRVDSSDNVFFVAGTKSTVIKIDKNGDEKWKTGQLDAGAQMNDLELTKDGLVVVGHKYYNSNNGCNNCGVIKGHMKKLDANGKFQWGKDYGNYGGGKNQFSNISAGPWNLIYNECWGVAPRYANDGTTQNGFVMSCGTGIEGCDGPYNSALLDACNKDPRTTWRSLAIATDLEGERVYSRMDSWQGGDTNEVWAAAAEYVVSAGFGKHMIITDEAMGFAFLTIEAFDDKICTKADVVAPPTEVDFNALGEESASTVKYSAAATVAAILFGTTML